MTSSAGIPGLAVRAAPAVNRGQGRREPRGGRGERPSPPPLPHAPRRARPGRAKPGPQLPRTAGRTHRSPYRPRRCPDGGWGTGSREPPPGPGSGRRELRRTTWCRCRCRRRRRPTRKRSPTSLTTGAARPCAGRMRRAEKHPPRLPRELSRDPGRRWRGCLRIGLRQRRRR